LNGHHPVGSPDAGAADHRDRTQRTASHDLFDMIVLLQNIPHIAAVTLRSGMKNTSCRRGERVPIDAWSHPWFHGLLLKLKNTTR
jgi:hypothetical protein